MVSGGGDLTFTGIVFSWFPQTRRRKNQGQNLQPYAVQNCDQVIVQALVCSLLYQS